VRGERVVGQMRGKDLCVVELVVGVVIFGVICTRVGDIGVEVRDVGRESTDFGSASNVLGHGDNFCEFGSG